MRRVPSQSAIRRTQSVPMLAPVWEPEDSIHDLFDGQPPWANTACSMDGGRPFNPPDMMWGGATPELGISPGWRLLLEKLESEVCRSEGLSSSRENGMPARSSLELMAAVQESMRRDPLQLKLQHGLVEQAYTFKREMVNGAHCKIIEAVENSSQKNFSLKIVPLNRHRRGSKQPADPMHLMHLISLTVNDAYCHPNYVCMCMKWGMHEVDSSHQLSTWLVETALLLRELSLWGGKQKMDPYVRIPPRELVRILLRTSCLDLYLRSNWELPYPQQHERERRESQHSYREEASFRHVLA